MFCESVYEDHMAAIQMSFMEPFAMNASVAPFFHAECALDLCARDMPAVLYHVWIVWTIHLAMVPLLNSAPLFGANEINRLVLISTLCICR